MQIEHVHSLFRKREKKIKFSCPKLFGSSSFYVEDVWNHIVRCRFILGITIIVLIMIYKHRWCTSFAYIQLYLYLDINNKTSYSDSDTRWFFMNFRHTQHKFIWLFPYQKLVFFIVIKDYLSLKKIIER